MTYDQFLAAERTQERAINAARAFANSADVIHLKQAAYILQTMRHASLVLCDPRSTKDERDDAHRNIDALFSYT
jgi:hypothetical protein